MIRVAIIEDDAGDRRCIIQCLHGLEETEKQQFSIAEFATGAAFIENNALGYDIVFMDIDMPGMDGMETARELRQMDPSVILIFVTNMAQYAIQGYEVSAMDFILKPINRYSFAIKVKRAIARLPRRADAFITVRIDRESRSVRIAAIKYLEVEGH